MDSVFSRYAIALLSIASEKNLIEKYIDDAKQIVNIFTSNNEITLLLKSINISKSEKKDFLEKCFSKRIPDDFLNLFYVIVDNSRGKYIIQILDEFIRISYKRLNISFGNVYTTFPLDASVINKLEDKVSKMLNCKVILENVIDTKILGGFKIKVGDYIIDDTFNKRLDDLSHSIV